MPAEHATVVPGRIGIVGLGLIGGSFAKALHRSGAEVFVANRTESTVELALIESATGRLDETTLPTCELIILCSFPAACIEWLEEHAHLISAGAIVIDACGTKEMVCREGFRIAAEHGFRFMGCHPMAGTQYSGFAHSKADLFRGAPIVFCPPAIGDLERADLIERVMELLGPCSFGTFSLATPEEHDTLIAYTSQLPHVIANAYVKSPTNEGHLGFTGGSYRDLTRVAHLSAPMWCELFLENADRLSAEIGGLIRELSKYKDAIDANDSATLERLLEEGDRIKREDEEV